MAFRVHGSRRIEHAERSVDAVKCVKLGKGGAAARLNPGDLETILVLRAQDECDCKDKDNYNEQSEYRRLSPYLIAPSVN